MFASGNAAHAVAVVKTVINRPLSLFLKKQGRVETLM